MKMQHEVGNMCERVLGAFGPMNRDSWWAGMKKKSWWEFRCNNYFIFYDLCWKIAHLYLWLKDSACFSWLEDDVSKGNILWRQESVENRICFLISRYCWDSSFLILYSEYNYCYNLKCDWMNLLLRK
jgi:hypothetical protein